LHRFLPRFRLASLIWASLVAAILMMWHRDRQALIAKYTVSSRNAWSIDQVLGRPNTTGAGDIPTAWASALQDSGPEWIIAEFPKSIDVTSIVVHETYNPGALVRIDSVSAAGAKTKLWSGIDPTPPGAPRGVSTITLPRPVRTRRIQLYLDSVAVPGWNEIDAIGIQDATGRTYWASGAWAGSSYGKNRPAPTWFWP
jgi:hypothetical protein